MNSHNSTLVDYSIALEARPGHAKGCSGDVAALTDAADMYGHGATKRLSTLAASAYPAALSAAHTGVISGKGGFYKPAMVLIDELKQDSRLYACAARSTRFYKARDRPGKFVQLGTVLQGRDDFYTSRLVQKNRCFKYLEELLADTKARLDTRRNCSAIPRQSAIKAKVWGGSKLKGEANLL